MPQIINEISPGARIGQSFGTGLGQGLQALAERKMQNMMAEKQRQAAFPALKALGYNDEQAQALSYLDPEIQKIAITERLKGGGSAGNQDISNFLYDQNEQEPTGIYSQKPQLRGAPGEPVGVASQKESVQRVQPRVQDQLPKNISVGDQLKLAKFREEKQSATNAKLEPYLKGKSEDYVNAKKLKGLAEKMRDNLKKNKNKWPSGVGRYIPDVLRSDKDLRKYASDADKLVLELAGSRKGTPTNFKVRLEQSSKPNLSQPYQTQLESLNDIIKNADDSINSYQRLLDIKKKHGGKFPSDIREQLLEGEFDTQQNELTQYVGSPIAQDDSGTIYKWDESQQRYRPAKPKG